MTDFEIYLFIYFFYCFYIFIHDIILSSSLPTPFSHTSISLTHKFFVICCVSGSVLYISGIPLFFCPRRVAINHAKIKAQNRVLKMLKRLDKIRFRGPKRDEFLDIAESPNASDSECNDELLIKPPASIKDGEDIRDSVSVIIKSWVLIRIICFL